MNPKVVTAALALAAVTTMTPLAANAAPYWPWCSRYDDRDIGGLYSGAFTTWEQCMDTVRGIGGVCVRNPYPPAPTPAKSRRNAARN
jgi:hypothetical protein